MAKKAKKTSREDYLSVGQIIRISKTKNGIGKVTIRDSLTGKKEKFEYVENEKIDMRPVLKEMKALKMPATVTKGHKESGQPFCFYGTFAYKVKSFKVRGRRITGRFKGSLGGRFVIDSIDDLASVTAKLKDSRDNKKLYWFTFGVKRTRGRLNLTQVTEVHDRFKVPACPTRKWAQHEFDEPSFAAISIREARDIFESFESTSPGSGPLTGIPFLYPDDGCEVRCHAMVREILFRKKPVRPYKLWVFNPSSGRKLRLETPNHPDCVAQWTFHTAPAVRTTRGLKIIDPSVCRQPESVSNWLDRFTVSGAKVFCTSHHSYFMSRNGCRIGTDPQYKTTEQLLRYYRVALRLRACHENELPPYDKCLNKRMA